MCMTVLSACASAQLACVMPLEARRKLHPLKLELEMVVSFQWDLEDEQYP